MRHFLKKRRRPTSRRIYYTTKNYAHSTFYYARFHFTSEGEGIYQRNGVSTSRRPHPQTGRLILFATRNYAHSTFYYARFNFTLRGPAWRGDRWTNKCVPPF